jgi:hypothetical protein
MMMDKQLQFASAQTTGTLSAATNLISTNIYDLWGAATSADPRVPNAPFGYLATEIDPSEGQPLYAVFTITTAFVIDNTTGLFAFSICDSDDGTTAANLVVKATTGSLTDATGNTAAGTRYILDLKGRKFTQRYLVAALQNLTPATHAFASGNWSCDIVTDVQSYQTTA